MTAVTDDFTSFANFTSTNTAWGAASASGGHGIGNSTSDSHPENHSNATWSGAGSFTNDQYAQVKFGVMNLGTAGCVGVLLRSAGTTYPNHTSYICAVIDENIAGKNTLKIVKCVNSSGTTLVTNSTITWATGDTLRAEIIGSTISVYRNGGGTAVATTTDSAIASGKPGISCGTNGTTSTAYVDDFAGGDIASGDTTAPTYSAGPSVTANTNTTVSVSATASDETASHVDHYVGIYADGSTPSAANIKAAGGTGFVAGGSGINVANAAASTMGSPISGLTGSVPYDAWFTVEENGGGNLKTPTKVDLTTACTLSGPLGAMDATTGPTGNTASGGITVTGATGTAYWYLSNSGTPPSVANLKAGTSSLAFGNSTITVAGAIAYANKGSLAEKTNYWFHYVVNQNSQDSTISSSASFQATDAPTLSSATAAAASATSGALSVATDRAAVGTCWVVVTTSSTKPTSTQIKAGQNNGGTAAAYAANDASVSNPQLFTATGLTTGQGYFAHFYQEDAGSDGSNIITSNSFTPTSSGVYNIDAFSPGTIRPGDTVTANISGAWSGVGMTATINGHPITLSAQSASQVQFTQPTYHTNPTFVDSQYAIALVFTLNDGANNQAKNLTVQPPSGYDFLQITGISGIFTDDVGIAVNDDHLGHWTVGTADPISSTGVLSNITGYPATYVYWRFDESEHLWTASASEIFYEVVSFTGAPYVDKIYYDNVAITTLDLAASFNAATANISSYAQVGDAVPGLSLNTSTGALTGTPTTPAIYQYTVRATDSDGNTAISNTFNITVYGIPVWSINPTDQTYVDGDVVLFSLSSFINTDGLSPAVSWSKVSGTYPATLTLDTVTGDISGTLSASASQSSPYTNHVYRATNPSGTDDSDAFSFIVLPLAPTFVGPNIGTISISTGAMTPVDVSAKFAVYITSYAFDAPVPAGITINSSGVISGTPTTFGTFATSITGTNASGTATSNVFNIIASAAVPTFTGNITNKGPYALGVAITPIDVSAQFGGGAATNYLLNSAPPGFVISAVGVISGTPTGATSTNVTVTKVNDAGSAQSNVFTITVVTAAPQLTNPPLPNRNNFTSDVVAAINFNLLWTGATSVAVTNLPTGLTDTSGSVAGTVTTVQTKTVVVTATNALGSTVATFTWVVSSTTPVLSGATATTGANSATLHVTTTAFSGQVRWVMTQSATPPTAAQVKAGQNNGGTAADKSGFKNITAAGAVTGLSATGLVPLTTYYGYIVHTLSGVDSNVAATGSFQPTGSGGSGSGGGSGIIQSIIQG